MNKIKTDEDTIYSNLSITPDWQHTWTKEQLEHELAPFKFEGAAWYITKRNGKTDTLLIIPYSIEARFENQSIFSSGAITWGDCLANFHLGCHFSSNYPEGTRFKVCCWNGGNPRVLFGSIVNAPTRIDER